MSLARVRLARIHLFAWVVSVPLLCVRLAIAEEVIAESPLSESDRDHWAFQPLRRPELPAVAQPDRLRTGVDAFLAAKLAKKGLSLAPEANRDVLLRRLTFDLTGLPPTVDELAAFVTDESPDAYEKQVDRLLSSPAHGERWAQHWLDLARFAETDGFEHDKVRPEAWKYRDWVIAALNSDLPYDQFVALQVAGDELPRNESLQRAAAFDGLQSAVPTTFCLAGPDMPDQNDQIERRHNLLNDLTSTVGSVLLGLQLGCAQCHDHKYDPISQADFYRLRAVFEPAVPILKRDRPCNMLASQKDVPPARLWMRGDHRRPGPKLPPGFPRIADDAAVSDSSVVAANGSHSATRSGFAAWLFRDSNPLTARVMANRVWQYHFGRGIFDTPSDVGLINAGPTHPELLDWLATELRESGWSLKHLHRTIVLSSSYRQTSRGVGDEQAWKQRLAKDPQNELYSRFPRQRLDGESLRDAMLASAGLLSGERGGPGVMPPLPEELTSTLIKGQWSTSKRESDHFKRSIYLFSRRNLRYPIFEAFDRPDGNASCPVRSRSTTAPQSLVLLNSEFSLLSARHLAGRLQEEASDRDTQVQLLFERALSRQPTNAELSAIIDFLARQQESLSQDERWPEMLAQPAGAKPSDHSVADAALVDACLAIFNSNEFLYLD